MFASILDDLKRNIQMGNMITRIILINVLFFVLIKLVYTFTSFGNLDPNSASLYQSIYNFFVVPAGFMQILTHPWTLFTHMFLHVGLWDLIWNMLLLYWFGTIVGDFLNNQRVLPIYIFGGLSGALFFSLSENLLFGLSGSSTLLVGATASRLCMIFVAATLSPDYSMRLILLGNVKIKYIALAVLLIDLIGITSANGSGAHFASLGGAFMGLLIVFLMRKGIDITDPFVNFYNRIEQRFKEDRAAVSYEPKLELVHVNKGQSKSQTQEKHGLGYQEKLDLILDKINSVGYENLSEEEKAFLDNASKKD